MDRRQFLIGAGTAGMATLLGGTIAACDGESGSTGATATVRVAAFGDPSEPVNPMTSTSPSVFLASYNIWDSLALLVGDEIRMQLGQSIEPNADATVWTVRLRPATFSDGTPITSDDALASVRALAASPNFGQFWSDLDTQRTRVVDAGTLEIALTRPRADFLEATLSLASFVLPAGRVDVRRGSGPYRLESGDPASGLVLVVSDRYYGTRPSVTRVEVRTVPDATARQNALTSGQIDLAIDLDASALRTLRSDRRVEIESMGGSSATAFSLIMNTRTAPFRDAELRRAMMLAIDREQLVSVVFAGTGSVGNDLVGKGLPGYDDSIAQRTRDVARSQQIFAAKGVRALTLKSSEVAPGMNSASELVKQQLADVGVSLTVEQVDATAFYADLESLRATPFLTSYYVNRSVAASLPFAVGANSPYNFSGFDSPTVTSALQSAQREIDATRRRGFYDAAQREVRDNGAEVIWGYKDTLVGKAAGLTISSTTQGVPLFANTTFQ